MNGGKYIIYNVSQYDNTQSVKRSPTLTFVSCFFRLQRRVFFKYKITPFFLFVDCIYHTIYHYVQCLFLFRRYTLHSTYRPTLNVNLSFPSNSIVNLCLNSFTLLFENSIDLLFVRCVSFIVQVCRTPSVTRTIQTLRGCSGDTDVVSLIPGPYTPFCPLPNDLPRPGIYSNFSRPRNRLTLLFDDHPRFVFLLL